MMRSKAFNSSQLLQAEHSRLKLTQSTHRTHCDTSRSHLKNVKISKAKNLQTLKRSLRDRKTPDTRVSEIQRQTEERIRNDTKSFQQTPYTADTMGESPESDDQNPKSSQRQRSIHLTTNVPTNPLTENRDTQTPIPPRPVQVDAHIRGATYISLSGELTVRQQRIALGPRVGKAENYQTKPNEPEAQDALSSRHTEASTREHQHHQMQGGSSMDLQSREGFRVRKSGATE